MKKFYLIAAAAAAVLAAGCAKNEVIQNQGPGDAVSFGVYVPKTVTKAGATEVIDLAQLKSSGFGVFAAYSPGTPGAYNPSSSKMDFMWNQQVSWSDEKWVYSPVKYWPNQHGATSISKETDKLSFFAYGPYVQATPADGSIATNNTWGITEFSGNNADGDPRVSYVCNSEHPVDLVWGVINDGTTSWPSSVGDPLTLTPGLTYKNLIKPIGTPKVHFNFKHALAKIVVDVATIENGDGVSNIAIADDGDKATGTRIYIRSLTITGSNIYNSGTLNLNNTETGVPLWEVAGDAASSFALDITTKSQLYIAEKPTSWDDSGWKVAIKKGVCSTPTTLVEGMAIPKNKNGVADPASPSITTVNIIYDVITKDTNLVGNVSVIENNITKTIETDGFDAISAGKVYTIHLRLGMKTVDFDAEVTTWDTSLVTNVDLPANVNPAP